MVEIKLVMLGLLDYYDRNHVLRMSILRSSLFNSVKNKKPIYLTRDLTDKQKKSPPSAFCRCIDFFIDRNDQI